MTGPEEFRLRARAWLEQMDRTHGLEVRRGRDQVADLALGRDYMARRAEAGFAGINWPADMGGQGLGYVEKLLFQTEEMRFHLPTDYFGVSLSMPIPMLMRYGLGEHGEHREWVRERVRRAMRGDEIWCQLFSEPSVGSDLAGLRTRAEREGDGWVLNGQKLWTTWAQYSDYGIIVVRTDPTVSKHRGLTYFWVDMRAKGVEVRPVKLLNGSTEVNEVYFDNVRMDDRQRMSPVGGGFALAVATLMIERYSASDSAGYGPSIAQFVEHLRGATINGAPALQDGRVRALIARNHAMRAGLQVINARSMQLLQAGMVPGPEGSLNKLVSVRSRQKLSEQALDLLGAAGLHYDLDGVPREDWGQSWLQAPTNRIAGGADEILLNTIAEKVLGLPQDHRPDKGIPFNQIPA